MSGRSVSVYTDTCGLHEYLCMYTDTERKFSKSLIKRPQTAMFSNYVQKDKYSRTAEDR